MYKSHLTEADYEDLQRLQAVAERHAERALRRSQGLPASCKGRPAGRRDVARAGDVECDDREEGGRTH